MNAFRQDFASTFRRILFLVFPASIFLVLMRAQAVRLVFGAGHFSWEDTILTAQTLGFFAISLSAQALLQLLARGFYALQDTKTPVVVALFSVVLNVFASLVFGPLLGVPGLGLAYSISSLVNMFLLLAILHGRLKDLGDTELMVSSAKILVASVVAGVSVWLMLHLLAVMVNMHTYLGILTQAVGATLVGCAVYLVVAFVLRAEEVNMVLAYLTKARRQIIK